MIVFHGSDTVLGAGEHRTAPSTALLLRECTVEEWM